MTVADSLRHLLRNDRLSFYLLFTLIVAWMMPGIFPLISYEGDANSISAACEMWVADPSTDLNTAGYGYFMQPLTFFTIIGLKLLLPFAGCEQIYSVLTALCTIALLFLASKFINKLSGIGMTTALIALWLMPESYALAMYPNSEAPVLLITFGAFYLMLKRKYIIALVMLCVAPLVRFDVLLIYPAVLPIAFITTDRNWRKSLLITTGYAVSVAAVTWVGYELLDASILETYLTYQYWEENLITLDTTLLAITGCYSILGILLIISGLVLMIIRKQWILVAVAVIPIICVHFFQRDFGNASKHFSPCVFFAAICIGELLKWLWCRRHTNKKLFYCCSAAIVLFVAGFSYMQPASDKPLREFRDTLPRIAEIKIKIKGVEWYTGIGIGPLQYTPDEYVCKSGNIFYPLAIHRIKTDNQSRIQGAVQTITSQKDDVAFVNVSWETHSCINLWLSRNKHNNVSIIKKYDIDFNDLNNIYWYANEGISEEDTPSMKKITNALSTLKTNYPHHTIYIAITSAPSYIHTAALRHLAGLGLLTEITPGTFLVNS